MRPKNKVLKLNISSPVTREDARVFEWIRKMGNHLQFLGIVLSLILIYATERMLGYIKKKKRSETR